MPVYFAQSTPGAPIKIGFSEAPSDRIAQMRCPLSVRPVHLLAVIDGGLQRERAIHRQFADRRLSIDSEGRHGISARGEWFAPSPELLAFIRGEPLAIEPQTNGDRLREFLDANSISLRAAADVFGVTHPAVLKWTDGVAPKGYLREAIERWTGGAVRAGDWQSPEERAYLARIARVNHFGPMESV